MKDVDVVCCYSLWHRFGTRYSANAAVSLNQILFDGQVFVGLQARRAAMDFAGKNAELTAEIIKANALARIATFQ